jgi:hypothetical protein
LSLLNGYLKLANCFTQAIILFFERELSNFSDYLLSELDWQILNGLEEVLRVSYYWLLLDLEQVLIQTDSSQISADDVV